MAKFTAEEKQAYAAILRARKAAMYRSPASRARKAKRERQQARRDAEEAERCRLRMLAFLNLPGGRP